MPDRSSEDALTPLLATVRLNASIFAASELGAPWGVRTPGIDAYICYVVSHGEAVLVADGLTDPLALTAGSVTLVAPALAHEIKDSRTTRAVPFDQMRLAAGTERPPLRLGGSGAACGLICGSIELDQFDRPLFDSVLPPVTHISNEDASPSTRHLLAALAQEAMDAGAGAQAVLTRLAEILFFQILRAGTERDSFATGWLRGIGHQAIGRAMAAIHGAPAIPWTLERLAEEARMSRSSFASAFHTIVGETPFYYVSSFRMRRAARLLRSPGTTIKSVAAAVGYTSPEAFSRTFRAWAGVSPGAYRSALTSMEVHRWPSVVKVAAGEIEDHRS